jgi:hypothetical protein
MTAKKKASRSTAGTRKTAPQRSARGGAQGGAEAKGLPGRASRGKEMAIDLGPQAAAAAATVVEMKEPRPYSTRYPIDDQQFSRLKASAEKARPPKTTMPASADAVGARAEIAGVLERQAQPAPELAPAAAPSPATSFAGIPATGWIPPDCTMAVGPAHVLLSVNSSIAIHNKLGGAPVLQRTLTQWFANVVQGLTIFDPKVLYDQHAARWVLLAVAFKTNPNRSVFLLSVSATSNPVGQWRNYVFDAMKDGNTATNNWADFPGLGVDAHALYFTANMFAFGGGFQYAKIRVVPKAGPYSGGAAPYWDFVKMKNANNTMAFTIQPCHTFGAPQVEYLVNSLFPNGTSLTLWRIANLPNPPVLTKAPVPTAAYSLPPNADQSGGPAPLNTGDVRVQHAVFRGDSVWTAITTVRNWGAGNRASIHWFQIRAAATALIQQGVFGTRDAHYFYPAGCPDSNGNFIMVFSRSGANQFGSIGYTGRKATDPPGTLQSSALLKAGVAHYQALDNGGRNRWGDYNGVASDPSSPRLVWFYSEFASAVNTWATWVGSAFF